MAEDTHSTVYRLEERAALVYKLAYHPVHGHMPLKAIERGTFVHHAKDSLFCLRKQQQHQNTHRVKPTMFPFPK